MKQKMVIKVCIPECKKSRRNKVMELAARADGVTSMGLTGDDKDRLEVVGDNVDLVCLVSCLRRKVGPADILLVEDLKEKAKQQEKPKPQGNKKPEDLTAQPQPCPGCCHYTTYPPPHMIVYDEPGSCAIL